MCQPPDSPTMVTVIGPDCITCLSIAKVLQLGYFQNHFSASGSEQFPTGCAELKEHFSGVGKTVKASSMTSWSEKLHKIM